MYERIIESMDHSRMKHASPAYAGTTHQRPTGASYSLDATGVMLRFTSERH